MIPENLPTIECLYSCEDCGIKDQPVKVPARTTEEVVPWVEATGVLLGADHHKRSPFCRPATLSQVKIPIPEGVKKIGGALPN